ncbi:Outer dense fiber protein 3-like protein 2 [Cladochytrium tenue]|nr:Outer dense fiber protein 3-like protein 2 [Cladochytrium tenue]
MADKVGNLPKLPQGQNGVVSNESSKEIPIAARSKGPGPAAYTLPSTIGLNAKTGKRAPAYSFGIKLNYDKQQAKETPGPNAFFPQTTRTGTSKGPAFSLQGGYKKSSVDGPAAYSALDPSKIKKSAPAYSLGSRWHHESESPFSGLKDAYEVHSANGHLVQGPTPGPGQYTPSTQYIKNATPEFSFRCKHSEYELFVPDTSDGDDSCAECERLRGELEQLRTEFDEFQNDSSHLWDVPNRDYEAELDKEVAELRARNSRLQSDLEAAKAKLVGLQKESTSSLSSLQTSLDALTSSEATQRARVRELEISNAAFETGERIAAATAEDLRRKLAAAEEKAALLETEMEAREEAAAVAAQRMRDELRGGYARRSRAAPPPPDGAISVASISTSSDLGFGSSARRAAAEHAAADAGGRVCSGVSDSSDARDAGDDRDECRQQRRGVSIPVAIVADFSATANDAHAGTDAGHDASGSGRTGVAAEVELVAVVGGYGGGNVTSHEEYGDVMRRAKTLEQRIMRTRDRLVHPLLLSSMQTAASPSPLPPTSACED